MSSYVSKNHSKFLLKFHIIFVRKYRRKLLVGGIGDDMKRILDEVADESDFDIDIAESDKDHIHLLVSASPKLSPLSIVRRLKQVSTRRIYELHGSSLRKAFYREQTFWTDGYFVSSIGDVSQETVRKYIENQG